MARIAVAATAPFGADVLERLAARHEIAYLLTQPDRPKGRGRRVAPPPAKQAGETLGIPVRQPERLGDEFDPETDTIVAVAYGQLVPRGALDRARWLNVHPSLLPRWRGAAPIQAAIAAGDQETGITVMYMDEGLDTGDILLQRKIDILRDDTGGSLHDRLARIAPEALFEALRMLAKGSAPRIPQDNALATYASKLKRENGKIDWSEPAEVIERKIRAFNPWPGAFMKLDGRNLKIFSALIVDLRGEPGQILRSEKELVVAAARRALSLGEVQFEGKRRLSAAEFLRGHAAMVRAAG